MARKKLKLNLKKGAFTAYCKRKGYSGVTMACINEAMKSNNPKTKKRAVFAKNVKTGKFGPKRKKKKGK